MSNKLGLAATAGIITAGALGIWFAPLASADAPLEDSPDWSCVDDGNRVCGPDNANGVPAGCYDEGGVLVALWPCEGPMIWNSGHPITVPGAVHGDIALGA
jgi:hypothetical protein